jgi:carbonic anhydrase
MCQLCSQTHPSLSRRALLSGSAALLAATAAPLSAFAQTEAPQNAIAVDAALKRIMDGNARYAANTPVQKDISAGRAARAKGQYPVAAILSCADSRVAPELAFEQGPGDLFVVCVAGNFVNDDGLASIEYAVKFLGVPLVMVLGHSNCGAVDATIKVLKEKITLPGQLQEMIRDIRPAVEAARPPKPENLLQAAIEENVRHGVRRLTEAKPIVSELVSGGKVKVVGANYDLATGKVALISSDKS